MGSTYRPLSHATEVHATNALLKTLINSLVPTSLDFRTSLAKAAQGEVPPQCAAVFASNILFAATQPNKRARADDGDDDDEEKSDDVNYQLLSESSSAYSPQGDSDLDLSDIDLEKEL